MKHKESKQNIKLSEERLLSSEYKHRMETFDGEIKDKNYLKIDNTNISAKEVAKMLKERFDL